jgi:hypothetical protein
MDANPKGGKRLNVHSEPRAEYSSLNTGGDRSNILAMVGRQFSFPISLGGLPALLYPAGFIGSDTSGFSNKQIRLQNFFHKSNPWP